MYANGSKESGAGKEAEVKSLDGTLTVSGTIQLSSSSSRFILLITRRLITRSKILESKSDIIVCCQVPKCIA